MPSFELHRHNNPYAAAKLVRVDGLAAKTCHVLVPPTCTIPPFATQEFVSISPWRAIPSDPCIHFGASLGDRHLKYKHLSLLPTFAAMLAEGIQQQSWNVVKDRVPAPCENCLGGIHGFPRQMGASAHGDWNSGALLDVPDNIAQQHRCEFVPEAILKM